MKVLTSLTRHFDGRALQARLRDELTGLAGDVDAVRRSRAYTRFLDAMACFWRYSPFNTWLIRVQLPTATRVAGVKTWEKLGRAVTAGAEPLVIFGPPGRGTTRHSFLLLSVYDVSQTHGQPLPTLDTTLHGQTRQVARLEAAARKLGIKIVELKGPRNLVGQSVGGEIRIRSGVSSQERAATIAHELAHELLHHPQGSAKRKPAALTKAEMETEAETTAHVVLRVLHLPSKAPAYVAWQGGDGKLVLRSLKRVQRAAKRILEAALGPTRIRAPGLVPV